jgi:MFS family permease
MFPAALAIVVQTFALRERGRALALFFGIAAGLALLVVFYYVEVRTPEPLMAVSIFRIRPFLVENLVLAIAMLVFIPVFFFASEYAQIALGKTASQAGLYLLFFFLGFATAAQIGGRMLDRVGARRPVVLGCALSAVGFALWASKVTQLDFGSQIWFVIIAGAGMGLMLGQSSTDAVNRASRMSYGEATGITQTVRNYSASLGIAILGTILVAQLKSHVVASLLARGVPHSLAVKQAAAISQSQGGNVATIPHFIRLDFADATRTIFYIMAGIMVVAAIVARRGLEPGVQVETIPAQEMHDDDVDVSRTGHEGKPAVGS